MDINDIRILTLKRWNLPQTKSLKMCTGQRKLGDYVAFRNYHFIDIAEVNVGQEEAPLVASYRTIQQIRKDRYTNILATPPRGESPELKMPDTYVQQCMVLLGAQDGFWQQKSQRLSITMLQLTDTMVDYKQLEADIQKVFTAKNIPRQQWALYYSLDFCDLIIFAKDIPYHMLHNILWDFSPFHHSGLECIRDTITIYCFENDYLISQLERVPLEPSKHEEIPTEQPTGQETQEEKVSLSIGLSIQSIAIWNELRRELERDFSIKMYRTLGRYDIQLLIEDIKFQQMFSVIRAIDKLCERKANEVFGGYEIALWDGWSDPLNSGVTLAAFNLDLFLAAQDTLDTMYEEYVQALNGIGEYNWGYAAELKQSILALLKNGFSEEFAIGVLMSFIEYLRFVIKNITQIKSDLAEAPSSSKFYIFQRKYFQALNMLTHCTMHSEKQFIQAPAFNATLCDIPPKLLACYEGFSYQITQILNDERDKTFSFQIVPDFQPEIYIKQISYADQGNSKLSIIYLSERLFYDPVSVVTLMCHEIAHYVGNESRMRKTRAELILSSIGFYLLLNAAPFATDEINFVQLLGNVFGKVVLERYERYYTEQARQKREKVDKIQYFLDDITAFIVDSNYLLNFFESPDFKNSLQTQWRASLEPQDVSKLLQKLDASWFSCYFEELCTDKEGAKAALDMLAGTLFLKLRNLSQEWSWDKRIHRESENNHQQYIDFCYCIMGAFQEAYSDLRMVQLLGISMGSKYSTFLRENSRYRLNGQTDFQTFLRHDAVCEATELESAEHMLDEYLEGLTPTGKMTMALVADLVKKSLVKYLKECYKKKYDSNLLKERVKNLQDSNTWTFFACVQNVISEYRKELCTYCSRKQT